MFSYVCLRVMLWVGKCSSQGWGPGLTSILWVSSTSLPDFKHLSRVPEASATCLLLVPDEGQILAQHCQTN